MAAPLPFPVTIRDATETDLEAINALYEYYVTYTNYTFDNEPWSLEERRNWFARHGPAYPVVVAVARGEVIGWCSLSRFHARAAYEHTAEDSIYISTNWTGRGVGRMLLGEVLTRARRMGYHSVIARIGDHTNESSRELHAAMGFVEVGIEREVGWKSGKWLDVVVMQWWPTPPAPRPIIIKEDWFA